MFDIIVDWKRIEECTVEEKDELLKYIAQLLEIGYNFYTMGIECFTAYFQNHADNFEKVAIELVCQGCMPDTVSIILSNLIQSTGLSNYQYLRYILFSTFILMQQKGAYSSIDIKRILLSYLGIEYSNHILLENR